MRKPKAQRIVVNSVLPRGSAPLVNNTWWPLTQWVNERLACFTQGLQQLDYFNASAIFLLKEADDAVVDYRRMKDFLHPSGLGSREWGAGILEYHNNIVSSK